jgi:hypothetical protein
MYLQGIAAPLLCTWWTWVVKNLHCSSFNLREEIPFYPLYRRVGGPLSRYGRGGQGKHGPLMGKGTRSPVSIHSLHPALTNQQKGHDISALVKILQICKLNMNISESSFSNSWHIIDISDQLYVRGGWWYGGGRRAWEWVLCRIYRRELPHAKSYFMAVVTSYSLQAALAHGSPSWN